MLPRDVASSPGGGGGRKRRIDASRRSHQTPRPHSRLATDAAADEDSKPADRGGGDGDHDEDDDQTDGAEEGLLHVAPGCSVPPGFPMASQLRGSRPGNATRKPTPRRHPVDESSTRRTTVSGRVRRPPPRRRALGGRTGGGGGVLVTSRARAPGRSCG